MPVVTYSKLQGLDKSYEQVSAPQVSFLKLDNFIPSRYKGGFVKRGGSSHYATTGNVWGIFGYTKQTADLKTPVINYPIRHRRNGSTSTFEKLDWTTDTWGTVTLGAQTSFAIGSVASSAQIDAMMCVCAGRPARISDIDTPVLNRLGGPAPTTAPTWTPAAGSLTGLVQGFYTFYDSTTGWESSPSPFTSLTTLTSQKINWSALETTCAREGVDKKRLYRTQTTGELPCFRVTEVSLATTTYSDDNANSALGASGPEVGDNNPPPTTSYIVAAHENRFWIAKDNNLYYSKAYDGNYYNLEQFSDDRRLSLNSRITGLCTPQTGGLYVFCAPGFGVHEVQGRSQTEFVLIPKYPKEGTNFHSSISTHKEDIAFWGASGPRVINYFGPSDDFDEEVRNLLGEILSHEYTSDIFVWSQWSEDQGAFIFGFGATDSTGAMWVDSESGVTVPWVDSVTGAIVPWST